MIESLIYLLITFVLLGFRFGIGLIASVIGWLFVISLYGVYLHPENSLGFSRSFIKYIEYYIYAMWCIGLILRIAKLRDWIKTKDLEAKNE